MIHTSLKDTMHLLEHDPKASHYDNMKFNIDFQLFGGGGVRYTVS